MPPAPNFVQNDVSYGRKQRHLDETRSNFMKSLVYMRVDAERPLPNRETQEAIEEGERIARDPNVKGYHDMESLKAALKSDTPLSNSAE